MLYIRVNEVLIFYQQERLQLLWSGNLCSIFDLLMLVVVETIRMPCFRRDESRLYHRREQGLA